MKENQVSLLKKAPLFLAAHAAFFIGIFSLSFFGVATNIVLLVLAATIFMEVVFLTLFTQVSISKNILGLEEVKKNTEGIWADEVRIHTTLIHLGHQMKTIQQDLDSLKRRSSTLRTSNTQSGRVKIHA